MATLNNIYKTYQIPPDLYYQILFLIKEEKDKLAEVTEFVDDLPVSLKTKVNMHIYKSTYLKLNFLQEKSNNFITWACPLLKRILF